ncbi:nuclear transport factor 2 family protein [Mycobacterium sp. NPDC050853]|uniref:nuclear transport factor 2 family protein n=1 Tax=Mycobacterium sp. NPDC050853 TaxID=3155160 RepID=UPI00340DBA0E
MDADEIAQRLFAAIEIGDIDTVAVLYAPDIVVWLNTLGEPRNRDENLATLTWVARNLSDFRYTAIRRSITPDGFVQQHVVNAINRAGERVSVAACIVATISDGLITRIDEYLDSAEAATLLAK